VRGTPACMGAHGCARYDATHERARVQHRRVHARRLAVLIPANRRTMMVGELGKLLARGALLFWGYTRVQWVQTDVSPHARVQGNFPADAAAPADGAPHPGTRPGRSTALP